jgi:AraC-like DNA-binding protein
MRYQSHLPCDALKPYIRSFVISEDEKESTYKVLPDTGLVIGFQYKGRLYHVKDHEPSGLAASGVSGLSDRSRTFRNSANIGTVLVFFREGGAFPFFKQPLHELFRESISLDNFMLRSELLTLEDQLMASKTDATRIAHVEAFLIKRMTHKDTDKLVIAALGFIHKSKGAIRISELMEALHVSQSPLEKRFREAVGTSPKKFASIVRFKNLLQDRNPASSLVELAYEAGFYDQSHFIREFRNFTGDTPESYFKGQ